MKTLLLLSLLLGADAFQETWSKANAAYETQDYTGAIQGYEQLVASSVEDPEVFYNLGNAYFHAGNMGAAIANYERALRLEPRMEPARLNLEQAIRQTERHLARPLPPDWQQALLFWDASFSPGTVWWIAALSWCLFWLLLGIRQWRRVRFLRSAAAVFCLLALLFSISAWVKYHPPVYAVAVQQRVPVRFGTTETEAVHFELLAGDRVLVDQVQDKWVRVATVSGERGWAPRSGIILVGPPYEAAPAVVKGAAAPSKPEPGV